jgi:molecular chaperone DnaK
VTFEIDTNGIVGVHAKDLETGQEQSIQVTATSGLTQDEVKSMMQSAEDYMVERRGDEQFEAARQEAETIMNEIEEMFPEIERLVGSADFGRDAIGKARGIVDKTRTAIQRKDTNAVKAQVEQLARTQRMFKGVVARAE